MARLFNLKFAAFTSLFVVLASSATILAQNSAGGSRAAREAMRVRGRQTSQRRPPPQMALASLEKRPTSSLPPIVIYYSRDGAEVAASTKSPTIEKNDANIGESITIYYRTYKPSVSEPTRSAPKPNREQLAKNVTRSSLPKPTAANTLKSNAPLVDRPTNAAPAANPTTTAGTATVTPSEMRPVPPTEKPVASETSDPKPAAAEPPVVVESPAAKTAGNENPRVDSNTEVEAKADPVPAKVSAPPVTSPRTEPIVATKSATEAAPPPMPTASADSKPVTEVAPPPVSSASADSKPMTEAAPPPVSSSAADTKPATEVAPPPVSNSPADTKPVIEAIPPPVPGASADTKPATEAAPPPLPSSSTDTVTLNNTAVQLTREHRYAEASDLLLRAIQIEPGTFKFHRNLSIIYEQMNKMDEALVSAETAVKLAPSEPTALMQLCEVHLQSKEHSKALGCYEKLGKLTPLDSASQTFYGVALLGSGRVLDALDVLEKAAAANPASGVTLNALGFVYFKEKRFSEAISMFKKAVELEPDQEEMRFNLAIAQLAKGNKEGAISQYRILKTANSKLAKQLYEILFRDHIVSVDELKH